MEEIVSCFEKTAEDFCFSKSEKKALKQRISELKLGKREKDFLRSKIFDITREKFNSVNKDSMISWLETANKLLLTDSEEHKGYERALFSPGEACLNGIIQELKKAEKSIKICVFTISDNRLAKEIINCHKRGVGVRIITDNDKSFDKGSDIEEFVMEGIPVKIDNSRHHMHHKFAVIDDNILLTGSFNWTRSATSYNQENILVTDSGAMVKEYARQFEKLWGDMHKMQ